MLYVSLVLSGILLLAAFLAARYAKNPASVTFGWAAGLAILPIPFLAVVLSAVWLQIAVLAVGLPVASAFGRTRQAVRPLAVGSFLIAYTIMSVPIVGKQWEYERLRAEYPFESLEGRLPRGVPPSAAGDPARLESLEREIELVSRNRAQFLAALHADTTDRFVNSAGFGVGRMVRVVEPTEKTLAPETRDDAPPQLDYFQPDLRDIDLHARRPERSSLTVLHEDSFLDFVNPRGFGYVKDRRHVAGFQSHGFSRPPKPAGGWTVAGLELVGLLQHETPMVYVSAKLPRMDELKDAPTRPLDAFEAAALAALQGGADLHLGDGANAWRFVGAVRATKQCLGCHGGDRGALLGAFSYRLRPVE